MPSRIIVPPIPPVNNVSDISRAISDALNKIVDQLNQPMTATVDINQQRVMNVSDPAALYDAVNLHTLKKFIADIGTASSIPAATGGGFPLGTWTAYAPTVNNLTVSSGFYAYQIAGKTTFIRLNATGTSNGLSPTFTIPNTTASTQSLACTISNGGNTVAGVARAAASLISVGLYNATAFANTQIYQVVITGVYENT